MAETSHTDTLRRAALSRRLTAALLTPVLLLLLVGVLLALQLTRLTNDTHWLDHSDEVIARIHQLQAEVLQQESAVRGFLVTGDRSYLQGYVDARPQQAIDALRVLVADNRAQESRLDAVARAYEGWLAETQPATRVDRREAEANPERLGARKRRHENLNAAVTAMLAAEQDLRYARTLTSNQSLQQTRVAFIMLFVAVALTLAFLSRRQLGAIAANYGTALEAERAARIAAEDQDWIRTGHLKLSGATQGDLSLEELAQRILEALAAHMDAQVGAMFAAEDGAWKRCAGFALDARVAGPDTFPKGAGLIGRAAALGKTLRVRDVPPDYLAVRSGTGSHAPAEVVVIPAQTEGVVHAVVELGFFQRVAARTIELSDRAAESIAAAVRSAEYKARLRELLEKSQLQAQELRAQQEELRVANEELEEQRNVLSRTHAQLESRQEELETFNVRLEEQASELIRTKDALAVKAAEAERVSRYKSQFLANMSHELRTPLNSSLILAKLLAENREGNLTEEQVRFASTIYAAGNDLLTLINDVLDLAKIEAGKIELREGRLDIRRLARSVASTCEPLARDKGLEFGVTIADTAPEAFETDGHRLEQILRNLLSNALKFTDKGTVTLEISGGGDHVRFAVADTGIGIAEDQRAAIFDAFHQVDGTSRRKFGGTGLGLSISRDLARLLGGDIAVTSEVGRGSVFTLTLPLVRDAAARSAPARSVGLQGEGVPSRALPSDANGSPRDGSAAPAPSAEGENGAALPFVASGPAVHRGPANVGDDREHLDPARRLVLVVEDDERFAQILVDLAHELDFQCIVAHQADAGLELALRYTPTAVILDVNLPDHSGLSVLDRLKRNPATRHIPVHCVSVDDHAQAALSMGAVGYLFKPVDRETLAETFRKLEERISREVRRLLVIEDDAVQRGSLARLLGGRDVEIVAVGTVREALDALGSSTFDCVVTDLALPDGTGFELLAKMADDSRYAFPPVIVYTGRSLSTEEEHLLRKYSSSIIVKGARSPERLLDEVTLFLHRVESDLPPEQQRMLKTARDREALFDGRHVLVVEDDVRNIYALSSVLEPKGVKIHIARNGREALETLEKTPGVDLVLMDVMMPEMDGIQATREIRKRPAFQKLPIIALTAKAMRDDQERCREAGANDYISKPLDVDKFMSLLRVWMPK